MSTSTERQHRFKEAQRIAGRKEVKVYVLQQVIDKIRLHASVLNEGKITSIAVFTSPKRVRLDNTGIEYRLSPITPTVINDPQQLLFNFNFD